MHPVDMNAQLANLLSQSDYFRPGGTDGAQEEPGSSQIPLAPAESLAMVTKSPFS